MFKDIEKMLAAGATPETIYQEALRIEEAKKAAEAKAKESKNAEARAKLITEIANYAEAITGESIDKKFLKDTEDLLKEIEKSANLICEKENKCKKKTEKSDDEKLIEFMKMLGALS